MSAFKRKLLIVWQNEPPKRYIPLALGMGPGWQTFDRKNGRYLSDKEVKRLSEDNMREIWGNS